MKIAKNSVLRAKKRGGQAIFSGGDGGFPSSPATGNPECWPSFLKKKKKEKTMKPITGSILNSQFSYQTARD